MLILFIFRKVNDQYLDSSQQNLQLHLFFLQCAIPASYGTNGAVAKKKPCNIFNASKKSSPHRARTACK